MRLTQKGETQRQRNREDGVGQGGGGGKSEQVEKRGDVKIEERDRYREPKRNQGRERKLWCW